MKIRQLIGILSFTVTILAFVSCEKYELVEPEPVTDNLVFDVNGVKFTMVKIKEGTFRMGNEGYLFDVVEDETPSHNVFLNTFYIGETEVTQELWEAVMGYNPSALTGDEKQQSPVESVSWNDCQTFIDSLNSITGRVFSLPT